MKMGIMKLFKKKKQKSLDEIATKEMSGIFSEDSLAATFRRNGYSKEIAREEARTRKMDFLGPLYYEPGWSLKDNE